MRQSAQAGGAGRAVFRARVWPQTERSNPSMIPERGGEKEHVRAFCVLYYVHINKGADNPQASCLMALKSGENSN